MDEEEPTMDTEGMGEDPDPPDLEPDYIPPPEDES